jgi:drug/metabolite transporter (DMT)-like permease
LKSSASKLALLAGALIISFSPVLVKLAAIQTLGPTAIGFWRTLIGSLFLFLLVIIKKQPIFLSGGVMRIAALGGFFFFIDLFCWHRSIIYAGAGMATILGNTQVFLTAILSFFIFKERLTLKFMFAALAAFIGVILLVGLLSSNVQFTSGYVKGILFGLATGLAYSGYIMCLKRGSTHHSKPNITVFVAWTSLFCTFFLGLAAAFEKGPLLVINFKAIASIVGLGIFVQGVAWLAITKGLPAVKTAKAGLILLLQPTMAMVWGVIFFAEQLTPVQVVGAAITLTAMYLGIRSSKN